jgi:hypothetical protein
MLLGQQIEEKHLLFGFTDSSWNDDQDNGCSTGYFIITYMGGGDCRSWIKHAGPSSTILSGGRVQRGLSWQPVI